MNPEPTLTVPLSENRAYPIYIRSNEEGIDLSWMGSVIADAARSRYAVIISQPTIVENYGETLVTVLRDCGFGETPILTFPAGERHKNLATVTRLCERLYNLPHKLDRKSVVIALGGGVVGDVAGFVAAIYLRGLDFIQIPTTLLAMVDSSVGGKTGVDFYEGKNLIGAFHQPRAVLIDTGMLETLPNRELNAGFAEILKYGIIRDPAILSESIRWWSDISAQESQELMVRLIRRSCEIKAEVVVADEREITDLRAILNYGHTVGHALEAVTGYKRFKHGEAVAIGMMAAAQIGEVVGITPPDVRPALSQALSACGLPRTVPSDIKIEQILPLLALDKKAEGGKARFVLARALGEVSLFRDIDESAVKAGLKRSYAE